MTFDFFRLGLRARQGLTVAALCCLIPMAMAAPSKPASPHSPLPTPAPPATQPNKTESVKQAVQAIYEAEDAALLAQDLDGVMSLYTHDVVFFDSLTGKQEVGTVRARQAWVAFFQVPHQTLTAAQHEIKGVTLNKAGTGATVLTVHHLTMSAAPADGAASVTTRDSTLRCFWTKTGAGWRIRQERVLGVDTFVNGTRTEHNHKQVPT